MTQDHDIEKDADCLYLLFSKACYNHEKRLSLLCKACHRLGVEPVPLEIGEFDYSCWANLGSGPRNMFYNVTPFSHDLERICIHRNMTGFFVQPSHTNHILSSSQLDVALASAGVPVPRTVVRGSNDRSLLRKYVEYVGGFPLILKAPGGSRGVGVVKVETWNSLTSLADLLNNLQVEFSIKQFIENSGTIRAIVVGNKLVCSVLRLNRPDDFRCLSPSFANKVKQEEPNLRLVEPNQRLVEPNQRLVEIALHAARAAKYEFVGVDVIQDDSGEYYVLEVNFPQDFATPQEFSGIDVASDAVSHLLLKSRVMSQA